MATQEFGSTHTEKKLETVQKYLNAYATALKQKFDLIYVDACAGSGASRPKNASRQDPLIELDDITVGSAVRALSINPPFSKYVLNDMKKSNVASLRRIVTERFPHLLDRVQFTAKDANEVILDLCKTTNWKGCRAVVFIDPFGLQIKFRTLEALAATGAVDLWYLVPVHAMSRQVRGDGHVLGDGGPRVDEALGTTEWRTVVAVEEKGQGDLFGGPTASRKVADAAWFEKIAKDRLSTIFKGGVAEEALPLGRNGTHEFSLMFAWANPTKPASVLAERFAKAVLK